ncbi:MAG: hypothetical protein H0T95_07495 [Chthoniobacterales bacterium]|nr:hypothetical protein [Chthoniobacterales bacterium]
MLIDQNRIAVGIGQHHARGAGVAFVGLHREFEALRFEPALVLADIRELVADSLRLVNPTRD